MHSAPNNKTCFLISFVVFMVLADESFKVMSQDSSCPSCCSEDGLEIKYPFWKLDKDETGIISKYYYGYPGFGISCDKPSFMRIGYHKYEVQKIDYVERSIKLVISWEDSICPWPQQSFDLDTVGLTMSHKEYVVVKFYHMCSSNLSVLENMQCEANKLSNDTFGIYVLDDLWAENEKIPDKCNLVTQFPLRKSVLGRLNSTTWESAFREGFELQWTPPDASCKYCEASGGFCKYGQTLEARSPTCISSSTTGPKTMEKENVGIGSSRNFIVVAVLVLTETGIAILIIVYRQKLLLAFLCVMMKKSTKTQDIEMFLERYGSLSLRRYKYSDIKKMTNLFKKKLGQGGYGAVFEGQLSNGCLVAIKVLNGTKGNGEEFINEVATIGRTNHLNIVSLVGFCSDGSKRALIYEYMPNGSLEKFIFVDKSTQAIKLGWDKLYQITLGIARGLEYLHRGCNTRILHFDIKPHNILLDKDFIPKISDFGLAKLCYSRESIVSMQAARGTIGYIAPEVFCRNFSGVSYKSDVYSYGMMVLEMAGGRKNLDVRVENVSELYYPKWVYSRLEQQRNIMVEDVEIHEEEIVRKMILIGLWCIQTDPAVRPTMTRVVEMLEGSVDAIQLPPNPFFESIA